MNRLNANHLVKNDLNSGVQTLAYVSAGGASPRSNAVLESAMSAENIENPQLYNTIMAGSEISEVLREPNFKFSGGPQPFDKIALGLSKQQIEQSEKGFGVQDSLNEMPSNSYIKVSGMGK